VFRPAGEQKDALTRRASPGPFYIPDGTPYNPAWDLARTMKDAYERVMWVNRIVEARAKNCSRLPVIIQEGSGPDAPRVESHSLLDRLNGRANPYESGRMFRHRLFAQYQLSKKGVFVEAVVNRRGDIASLSLLNPLHTSIVPNRDTFIESFEVRVPSGETWRVPPFTPERGGVLWIRSPHPIDPYLSQTWIDAAGLSIDIDYYARLYNRTFMQNDGRPGGLIAVSNGDGTEGSMDPADARELQSRLSGGGPESAGRISLIDANYMEYIDTSTTPRDAQYVESRTITKGELLVAGGTPLSVLGDASGRTFDNADAEYEVWWKETNIPDLEHFGAFMDLLIGGWDDDYHVAHDLSSVSVLERDKRNREARAQTEWDKGLITLDEYRTITGKDPLDIPAARAVWITAGRTPVANQKDFDAIQVQYGGGPPADPNAAPPEELPPGEDPAAIEAPPEDQALTSDQATPQGLTQADQAALAALEASETKALGAGTSPKVSGLDAHAEVRARITALFDAHETEITDALVGLLNQQHAIVSKRLVGAKARRHTRHWAGPATGHEIKALDPNYVLDRERWITAVVDAVVGLIRAAVEAMHLDTLDRLDAPTIDGYMDNFDIRRIIAETARIIAEAFDSRSGRIVDLIGDMDQAGASITEIADAVDDAYADPETWAEKPARSVVGAMNGASLITATKSGATMKRWLATDDLRTRPTHRDAEGEVVPVGEPFPVGDALLAFPGDPSGGAATIGEWINCLVDPDTPIATSQGWKPVRDIVPGDVVLTHVGRWRRVTRLATRRTYTGPVMRLEAPDGRVLRVTPNHPVLVDQEWVVAGEIPQGSVLAGTPTVEYGDPIERRELTLIDADRLVATPALGHDGVSGQNLGVFPFDHQPRGQFGGKPSGRGASHLPTEHGLPVGTPGGLGLVNEPASRHVAEEMNDPAVSIYAEDTGTEHVLTARALGSGTSDRDGSFAVDESGHVSLRPVVHPMIVPLPGVQSSVDEVVDVTLYNFAVEGDESYVAAGFAVHNCRCSMIFQVAERTPEVFDAELLADEADLDAYEGKALDSAARRALLLAAADEPDTKSALGTARYGLGRIMDDLWNESLVRRDSLGRFDDKPASEVALALDMGLGDIDTGNVGMVGDTLTAATRLNAKPEVILRRPAPVSQHDRMERLNATPPTLGDPRLSREAPAFQTSNTPTAAPVVHYPPGWFESGKPALRDDEPTISPSRIETPAPATADDGDWRNTPDDLNTYTIRPASGGEKRVVYIASGRFEWSATGPDGTIESGKAISADTAIAEVNAAYERLTSPAAVPDGNSMRRALGLPHPQYDVVKQAMYDELGGVPSPEWLRFNLYDLANPDDDLDAAIEVGTDAGINAGIDPDVARNLAAGAAWRWASEHWRRRSNWNAEHLHEAIDMVRERDIAIALTDRGMAGMIEDGVYRTLRETGNSGGSTDTKLRDIAEAAAHGIGPDTVAWPVYGYLSMDSMVPDRAVRQYGNWTIVLGNDDDIRDRTTFTIGDSLGTGALPLPLNIDNPLGFPEPSAQWLVVGEGDDGMLADIVNNEPSSAMGMDYVEAQITGGVDLSNVTRILAPYHRDDMPPAMQATMDALVARGIEIVYDESDAAPYPPESVWGSDLD
jgi:phage portal protein BeeE